MCACPLHGDTPEYPEHEKLATVVDQSQTIGDFLDWLREQRYIICTIDADGELQFAGKRAEDLLAGYFGIDQEKIAQEKQRMLQRLREAQHV